MSIPKVTALMTVYNAERYLQLAVDSILKQTFGDFQLLIIDDASTDKSPDILHSYQDPRIRVIRNAANRGVAFSRKCALELAEGEYVAVLDADDVALPKRLQIEVEYLDRHPDIDVVGSAYQVINQSGTVVATRHVPIDPLAIRWALLFGNCVGQSTVMFRRERALQLGGYDERVFAGEDFDLWVRLAVYGKIAQLDSPLTQWRWHGQSLQNIEPAQVKDHFIWTVIKSVRTQTGLSIDFDVARCLFRDIPKPAASQETLLNAYAVIVQCLERFLGVQGVAASDKKRLCAFALEEIFRVALENPGSYPHAWRAAARCIDRQGFPGVLTGRAVRLALLSACPARMIDFFVKTRR